MSDCEEKKEEIAKDIEENCYLKYDFYLYLTAKETGRSCFKEKED